jgi:hypothetical protein
MGFDLAAQFFFQKIAGKVSIMMSDHKKFIDSEQNETKSYYS